MGNNRGVDGARGVVLDFCSTFGILSKVTSRKNLRSPFEREVAKRGVSPKANIFARGSRERAPIALLAKCEPLFATKARGGSTRGSAKKAEGTLARAPF